MDEVLGHITPEYFERHLKPVILENYARMQRRGQYEGWAWATKLAARSGFFVPYTELVYYANLSAAVEATGRLLSELLPTVYDTKEQDG